MNDSASSDKLPVAHEAGGKNPPPSPAIPKGPRLAVIIAMLVAAVVCLAIGAAYPDQLRGLWGRSAEGVGSLLGHKHDEAPTTQEAAAKTQYWTCGMHPQVLLPNPGDCPICHMKLVPVDASAIGNQIAVDPVITQSIGVRVAPVATGPVNMVIRTVGTVDYDETLVRDVNLKISGWVEKLHTDSLGMAVKQGQPLFDIYSPELVTAQEEYLQTIRGAGGGLGAATAPASDGARWSQELKAGARKRLENFGITDEQIKQLEKDGKASHAMTIRSPFTGMVVVKNIVEGQKAEAGAQLYRIADLSRVWIMVSLYEYQIPFVQLGQPTTMSLPYVPGQDFHGKVAFIYPYLNAETRQVRVRLEFANSTGLLKPGMFANVEIRNTLAKDRMLVPREAVIDTGKRQLVFVSLGQGRFEPRDVKVGVEAEGGKLEILDGLTVGEIVVTSSQFLLDSEARLQEARAKMIRGTLASDQTAAAVLAGATELKTLPPAVAESLIAALNDYLKISAVLAGDATEGIGAPAKSLAAEIDKLIATPIPGNEHFWHAHMEVASARAHALELTTVKDIADARERFANLSIDLSKLLKATGVPPEFGKEVRELHCPMYRQGQGGSIWLQAAGPVRNPFFGKMMLECLDRQVTIPVTGAPVGGPAGERPATPKESAPMQGMPGM